MDAALVETLLEAGGVPCKIKRVWGRHEFRSALAQENLDLILSDFSMPAFDGLTGLEMAKELRPEIPFIFLSGTIGEELAVEALREGATDYVLKDRMSRLPAAVQRAMREAKDLAEHRSVQKELRKSEERFQLAAHATQDVVWDWDLAANQVWRSNNFQSQFGYRAGELESGIEAWRGRIHPQDKERINSSIQAVINSSLQTWSEEYRFLRADDSIASILDRGYIIRDDKGKAVRMIGAMMDTTARKIGEERIREQAALLDCAQDAICLNDMSQQILYWNKGAERLYGWTAAEALGKNANDLLFQGELSSPQEALRELIRRDDWEGELHQAAKDGRKLIIESRWTLMRDDKGDPKSILVINTDITERKRLEAEFLRNQRVETIGALTGGIAHDLNNALTPVLLGVNVLQEEPISTEGKMMLDLMGKSVLRGSEMIHQILSFSRGVGGRQLAVDVNSLVEEMVRLAKRTFPRNIEIQTKISDDLPPIKANATQLHQVLLNLCVNARDAMPQGGTLTIEAENMTLKNAAPSQVQGLNPGTYVLLKVSDTGLGIAPELRNKIFEPFFTTKDLGKGTGLGLSTVMGIVKTHGGFLDVSSEVGNGTSFKVYLPANVAL